MSFLSTKIELLCYKYAGMQTLQRCIWKVVQADCRSLLDQSISAIMKVCINKAFWGR